MFSNTALNRDFQAAFLYHTILKWTDGILAFFFLQNLFLTKPFCIRNGKMTICVKALAYLLKLIS